MIARALGIWVAFCAPSVLAAGLIGDSYFETVGGADVIPDNNVSVLAQDQQGFIWIGTPNGLIRYDGYRFRRFARDPNDAQSLSGVFIRALSVALDGRVWVGTDENGISVFDPASERFTRLTQADKDASSLPNNNVRAIAAAPDGGMWVGTRTGIAYAQPGQFRFQQFPQRLGTTTSELDDRVLSMLLDQRGELWVGSWNGLSRLSASGGRFERVHSTPGAEQTLANELILSLYKLRDGRIGVGTEKLGSWLIDPSTMQMRAIPSQLPGPVARTDSLVLAMFQTSPAELLLGSFGGLTVVDPETGVIARQLRPDPAVPSSLAHSQVRAMLQDRAGQLWIGSYSGGLQRHNPANQAIRVLHHSAMRPHTLSRPSIGSILERSNGELWFGTRENGIDIAEPGRGVVRTLVPELGNPQGLGNGVVTSMAETPDGAIWVGTLAGLFRHDPNTGQFRPYGPSTGLLGTTIRRLLTGKNGELWIGSNAGLARWKPGSERIEAIATSTAAELSADVNALALESNGRLWVGSSLGLHTLAADGKALLQVSGILNASHASHNQAVVGLLVDSQDRLWIDTADGLNRILQRDGAEAVFDPVSTRLGIGGKSFGANLLEDAAGRIWTQYFVLAPDGKSVYELGRADGVDYGTPWFRSYTRTRDGLLMFGGSKGVLIIDAKQFQARNYQPPVVATELKVSGQWRPLGALQQGLLLQPRAGNFSLEFAALDYAAPQRTSYAYQLEGFDRGWIATDAQNRVASYTNLPPGEYALRVRASVQSGVWSPNELLVPVRALPAFWQTAWFAVLVLIGALAVAVFAVRRQTASMRRRALQLEQTVLERTGQLVLAKEHAEQALSQLRGTQRQLVIAEKMASLGQLVAGVAHELNTPLGIALTASSMLSDESRALKRRVDAKSLGASHLTAYLDIAERAGQLVDSNLGRAAQLVRSFKQVSIDRSFDERRRFELAEYLQDLSASLELTWKRRPLQLTVACPPGLHLDGFPGALGQVLSTFTQNAVLHAFDPETIGTMHISAERNGDEQLRLSFSDNGKGIAEADLPRVFEPFYTTRRGQGSTGLGLHIVFNLVTARLGGQIEVASKLGEGTRFSIVFPRVAPPASQAK